MKKVMMIMFGLCFTWLFMTKGDVSYAANYVEMEDNGSIEEATEIDCGSEVEGNISDEDDLDYYKFTISAPGKVTITFQHENLMDTERFWVAKIYDEKTNSLLQLDSYGIDITKESAEVGLAAGTYYVKINSDDAEYSGYYYNASTYRFVVNYESSDIWEIEPNDDYSNATTINVNETYYGVNQFEKEKDYYMFSIPEPGKVNISFQHPNLMSDEKYWAIRLYDVKTKELACLESKGVDTNSSVDVGLPAGNYYVCINPDRAEEWGYYHDSSTYQFCVNYTQSDVWEQETNDSFDTADDINVNTVYYGVNQFENERDYFKFILTQNQYISIRFSHAYIGSEDRYWVGRIFDEKTNERLSFDSNGIDTEIQSENIYLSPGTYYLEINPDRAESWRYNHSLETYSFCVLTEGSQLTDDKDDTNHNTGDAGNTNHDTDDTDNDAYYDPDDEDDSYSNTDDTTSDDDSYSYPETDSDDEDDDTGYSSTPSRSTSSLSKVKKLKVKAKKKSAVLTWEYIFHISGYQIQYATNKKFTSQKKTKSSMASRITIKKLKAKKTYYFRVRAYKWKNGKRVCGKWSSVKKAKIKK